MSTYTHSLASVIRFCLNYTSLFFLSDFSVQPHFLALSDISGQDISRMVSLASFCFISEINVFNPVTQISGRKEKRKLTNDSRIIPKCALAGWLYRFVSWWETVGREHPANASAWGFYVGKIQTIQLVKSL